MKYLKINQYMKEEIKMRIRGEEFIQEFIRANKDKYPDLYIDYDYDLESDWFKIWHNDFQMRFVNWSINYEFSAFIGQMIKDILYKNNIYNFSFGYDCAKATRMANTEFQVKCFIGAIKENVPSITKIEYIYYPHINQYGIWHNLKPIEEKELQDIIGNLIYDYFYRYEIYNINFAWDGIKFNMDEVDYYD